MVIENNSGQAPTSLDNLYWVMSSYEMSPHEIENWKWLLWAELLKNYFNYDPRVNNLVFICFKALFWHRTMSLCELSPHEMSKHGHYYFPVKSMRQWNNTWQLCMISWTSAWQPLKAKLNPISFQLILGLLHEKILILLQLRPSPIISHVGTFTFWP